jgi:hypothetical protein
MRRIGEDVGRPARFSVVLLCALGFVLLPWRAQISVCESPAVVDAVSREREE